MPPIDPGAVQRAPGSGARPGRELAQAQPPSAARGPAADRAPVDGRTTPALQAQAQAYARGSRADSTWRAYTSDMADFRRWCAQQLPPVSALPAAPDTVALYLTALAEVRAPATLRRRLSAISVAHRVAGHDSPTGHPAVRAVWAGIRRSRSVAPRKVRAARTPIITALVGPLLAGADGERAAPALADVRDRALLLLGFAGALRRSELVALDVADVVEDDHGLRLRIRRSKTDQDGAGVLRGLPYGSHLTTCPVRAWRAWLARSGLTEGPAFRAVDRHGRLGPRRLSDRAVADMIKRRAAAAGVEGVFAGHSLRAGFATEGYARGVPELAIMRHGRWRSAAVMRGYVEEGGLWADNAAARLGL
jgi:integrase